ncbi:MAG: hypothetical protein V4725_14220 [Bacteroidota bacterium]
MQRFNIFSNVHKGLRALLYHTANSLQQTDFATSHEADPVMKQVVEVMDLFDRHAFSEDNFVLPAVDLYEPAAAALFEDEHVEDHVLGNRIRSLVNIFNHNFITEERVILGGAVRVAFIDFLIFNLKHMAKEENLLNNFLWANYTDEQLHGITREIMAHIAPDDMVLFSRWMMNGMNNAEIIAWLKEVRNNAPAFVFNNLFSIAANELSALRWLAVKDSLVDGAMVA